MLNVGVEGIVLNAAGHQVRLDGPGGVKGICTAQHGAGAPDKVFFRLGLE
jgi:hypothetical protein